MKTETSMPIADIIVGSRYRKDMGDIQALADTIKEVGMLQPIAINTKNQLVAGQRRIEAVKLLGWAEVPIHVVSNMEDLLRMTAAEEIENTCRKPFTPEEAVSIGMARVEMLKPEAEEEKRKHGNTAPGRQSENTGGQIPPVFSRSADKESRKTKTKAAKSVGMSRKSFERASKVVDAAKQDSEKFGPILEEMNTTGNVGGAFNKVKEIQDGPKAKALGRIFRAKPWEEVLKALEKLKQLGNVSTHKFSRLDVKAAINNLYDLMHKNTKSN